MTESFYAITREETLATQNSSPQGLTQADATERLERYGRNTLPESKAPGCETRSCYSAQPARN